MILLFLGLFVILEIQPLLGVQVLQEYNLHIIIEINTIMQNSADDL